MQPTRTALDLSVCRAAGPPPVGPAHHGLPGAWSRWMAVGALCLGLAACGGQPDGDPGTKLTALAVTVADAFGTKVGDASVVANVGGMTAGGLTNAQGVAVLGVAAAGETRVTVSRATFVDKTVTATLADGAVTQLAVTLERAQSAAGGSLGSRGDYGPVVGAAGPRTLSFETELVVLDSDSRPLAGLSMADFSLRDCTPDPGTVSAECLRGADAGFDAGYTALAAMPESLTVIPGQVAQPFATALLMDQSGSIQTSDATGARLFAGKAFLGRLAPSDRVLLAAFADGAALIPSQPLTVYPPFRDTTTLAAGNWGPSYFAALDALAPLVGGNTPLYGALDLVRARIVGDTTLPAGIAKTIVVFTDGQATDCGDPNACRTRRDAAIQAARADGVRVFTIGLSSAVDAEALGDLAHRTGGAFLYADNAEQALTLYGSVSQLLSLSMPTYRLRWTVQVDSPAALAGHMLIGRVQVKAGQKTIEVPFVVAIP